MLDPWARLLLKWDIFYWFLKYKTWFGWRSYGFVFLSFLVISMYTLIIWSLWHLKALLWDIYFHTLLLSSSFFFFLLLLLCLLPPPFFLPLLFCFLCFKCLSSKGIFLHLPYQCFQESLFVCVFETCIFSVVCKETNVHYKDGKKIKSSGTKDIHTP